MTTKGARAFASRLASKEALARVEDALCTRAAEEGVSLDENQRAVGSAVLAAYPALGLAMRIPDLVALAADFAETRDVATYRRLLAGELAGVNSLDGFRRTLRRFAQRERLRIAIRELLVHEVDVDTTARELSDLADAAIDAATADARAAVRERHGEALLASGVTCRFVVLGMGKLGGRELNVGSDVDLVYLYESDEGPDDRLTLHEHFVKVAHRLTASLDEVTDDGFVFRTDLRLRPEGGRGPLVNSLPAAEHYYETWGRTWERAALLRARPVAGDLSLGDEALTMFAPFVWRREVNPKVAEELATLVLRARVEISRNPARDVKHGEGGIREAEFFVQALQLVWGGKNETLRTQGTLTALAMLRAAGLVTFRETQDIGDAYLMLRRVEHRIQFATELQTHELPPRGDLLDRIARSLALPDGAALESELSGLRRVVSRNFRGLSKASEASEDPHTARVFVALEAGDEDALAALFANKVQHAHEFARHLRALARRPDFPFGAQTRDQHKELPSKLLGLLTEAADPEQAARFLATLFSRSRVPSLYVKPLADDEKLLARLVGLLGASVFLAQTLVGRPDLVDHVTFTRAVPNEEDAVRVVDEECETKAEAGDQDDPNDALVGALRRAKGRVTTDLALADLAAEIEVATAGHVLTALAEATVRKAVGFALEERGMPAGDGSGLSVIALGKFGGRELGYGSDLDLCFVHDGPPDAAVTYARVATRAMRLLAMPHGDGPGYELDTRLRPSGNQGLLVVSLDAFARYHGARAKHDVGGEAADWERQALVRCRFVAGDAEVGAKASALASAVAFERGAPDPTRLHALRLRMESELGKERRTDPKRFDLKVGRGGLVDVEFAVQFLQMKHGEDPSVRSPETAVALDALESAGRLERTAAAALRDGHRFLRRLEQRVRVVHGGSATLLEAGAPGLRPLARRMAFRDGPRGLAEESLLLRYEAVTENVRAAYSRVLGIA